MHNVYNSPSVRSEALDVWGLVRDFGSFLIVTTIHRTATCADAQNLPHILRWLLFIDMYLTGNSTQGTEQSRLGTEQLILAWISRHINIWLFWLIAFHVSFQSRHGASSACSSPASKAELTSFPCPPAVSGLLQMVRHREPIVTLTTTHLCSIYLHSLTAS